MTYRERALAVLKGEKPDKVPWFGDLSYWMIYLDKTGQLAPEYRGEDGIYRIHRDLNVGFYLQGYFPFRIAFENIKTTVRRENGNRIATMETPYGILREHTRYSDVSFSTGYLEHYVKTPDDLKSLRYLYENMRITADFAPAEERARKVGDLGLNLVYAPKTPTMEMIALWAGIENFTYIMADDRDELAETLRIMRERLEEAVDLSVSAPSDCVMIPENISSESVGKNIYDSFIAGTHVDWNRKIKNAGKYSFVHLDGTMKGLLREISMSGFDVIEALTPYPVGDIPMNEISDWVSGGNVIWGGLPGAYFPPETSDSFFDGYVKDTLSTMKDSGRYVLGVADQVPPYTSFDRIRRVAGLVEKYG